ncbi:peroxidase 57-like [Phragmites australis]|uniref:peroxidase 57-like n=1 Tax=Phragmites australis TaxID=29695 RepID=UPI002D7A00A8|nr:peroxidase 57-like [Phragmites australis]
MQARSAALLATFFVVVLSSAASCRGQLANNYYAGRCGNASVETIIHDAVKARLAWDKRMVAGLLHLLFHDCFVTGCDASILLDGSNTEKTAVQNSGIFGYDHIDDIKTALENKCPGVVSCADIIVAATRDAVAMSGGPNYQVQLGRRDGMVSQAWMAGALPGPNVDIPTAIDMFSKKGFNSFDMAILIGAHTVGVTHCSVIHDRLYNFNSTGKPDPAMDPLYVWILTTFACPKGQTFDNIVYLDDPSSILVVDKSYYAQIMKRHGVLTVDQALGDHSSTAWMVKFLATTDFFPSMFSYELNKLAALEVLTGTAGEIRTNCRRTN